MTRNSYRSVSFEGVCSNLSNAAYPVERVRKLVSPGVEKRYENTAIHLALTLIHNEVLEWNPEEGRYEVTEHALRIMKWDTNENIDTDEIDETTVRSLFSRSVCEGIDVQVESKDAPADFAGFVELLYSVLDGMTKNEWVSEVERFLKNN